MLPHQFKPYHGASFVPNSLRAFGKSELFFSEYSFQLAVWEFVDYKLGQTSQIHISKSRPGGEIRQSDITMHEGLNCAIV